QHTGIERPALGWYERRVTAHFHRFAIRNADELEWRTCISEQPNVHSRAALAHDRGQSGVAGARALEQCGFAGTRDCPSCWNTHVRTYRLTNDTVTGGDRAQLLHREAAALRPDAGGRFEAQTVSLQDRLTHLDNQLSAIVADHDAERDATVVGMIARYVLPSLTPTVHPTREAPAVDLDERLHFRHARQS